MQQILDPKLTAELARRFGTPLYVYSQSQIERQLKALRAAVCGVNAGIYYAVKANSNLAILKCMHDWGCGFDIVSGGELQRVLRAGGDASKIVFSGVGKHPEEIKMALKCGVKLLNIESEPELKAVENAAKELCVAAPVALRVNPDISVDVHPYITTGLKGNKFGISREEVPRIGRAIIASRSLELIGLDCHIGSQIGDISALESAYRQLLLMAEDLRSAGAELKILDFGGGLAVGFSGHYEPLDLAKFSRMLRALPGIDNYEVIFEPGKFLVAEAGVLVTQVLYRKQDDRKSFCIVDAGMNDLIRPSLYDAYHAIEVVSPEGQIRSSDMEIVDVVGPVCESGCFFAKSRELPRSVAGDLILIRDSGAYGMSMASNYNSRLLPAEVLVQPDGSPRLIRRRQVCDDLWAQELL